MAKVATGKQMVLSILVSGTVTRYVEKASKSLNRVELNLAATLSEVRFAVKGIKSGDAWAEYQLALKVGP